MDYLSVTLILLLLPSSFAGLLFALYSRRDLSAVVTCIGIGWGLVFCFGFLGAYSLGLLFSPILAGVGALLLVVGGVHRRINLDRLSGTENILLVAAFLYFVIRVIPLFFADYPRGWDPNFHLVLSDLILQKNELVTSWRPYEDISLNYPLGSHVLLAAIHSLVGVSLHRVFTVSIIFFTMLAILQLYALVVAQTENKGLALYTALAFGFLADFGSFDYFFWGGLPSLIGLYLFLVLLTYLSELGRFDLDKSYILGGILFAALSFVHHHWMVTGGVLLIGLLFTSYRKDVLRILISAALIGAVYFVPKALEFMTLGGTNVAGYIEPVLDPLSLVNKTGWIFSILVIVGVFVAGRKLPTLLKYNLVGLLILFMGLDYLVRYGALLVFGQEVAPFTPSRFITNAVPFLAVFAGYSLLCIQESRGMQPWKLALVVLLLGGIHYPRYIELFDKQIPSERRAAYRWIASNSQSNSIVAAPYREATYFTKRASTNMPIPSSEPVPEKSKIAQVRALMNGERVEELQNREVLFLTNFSNLQLPIPSEKIWSDSSTKLNIFSLQMPPQ